MPFVNSLSFGDLQTQIKTEARVSGSVVLDIYVQGLINELLLDFCLNNRYFELLRTNQTIATLQSIGTYQLPDDFQMIRLVRYQNSNTKTYRILRPKNEYVENPLGSTPRFYEVVGNSINIFPFDGIVNDDAIVYDYYFYPTALTQDSDLFPVPRIINPLKLKAITRVLVYNNQLQAAQILRGDSVELESRGKVTTG